MSGKVYAGPMPGDVIRSGEQVEALSVGSVVTYPRDPAQRWQKGDYEGGYSDDYGWYNTYNANTYSAAAYTEQAIANGHVVESVPYLSETVDQFAARFRDIALSGCERALGSAERALDVLEDLKIPFRPSVGLRIVSHSDRWRLPDGSVVTYGDPLDWALFGVWVKKSRRGWTRVLGGYDTNPEYTLSITVDQLPENTTEPESWLTKKPTTRDPVRLAVYRDKVWAEAVQAKRRNRWCGEFERVMIRAGFVNEEMEEDD